MTNVKSNDKTLVTSNCIQDKLIIQKNNSLLKTCDISFTIFTRFKEYL